MHQICDADRMIHHTLPRGCFTYHGLHVIASGTASCVPFARRSRRTDAARLLHIPWPTRHCIRHSVLCALRPSQPQNWCGTGCKDRAPRAPKLLFARQRLSDLRRADALGKGAARRQASRASGLGNRRALIVFDVGSFCVRGLDCVDDCLWALLVYAPSVSSANTLAGLASRNAVHDSLQVTEV